MATRISALFAPLRLALLLCAMGGIGVGCDRPDVPVEPSDKPQALYGYISLGDEQIPVESFTTTSDEEYLMLKLSPLEDVLTATTYAVVAVRTSLLGSTIDVQTKYHNDDYIFVYEDPLYYYGPYRPLRSGTILLDKNGAGIVRVRVDVELYDGVKFRYENAALTSALF
ncbi:MAG: hypothetical protein J6R10_00925 [Tidjanibacter sp.]|nr:hypothetical protein [Tidjanibacter sp.]